MNSHIHVKIVINGRMEGGGLQIFVILSVVKWSIYINQYYRDKSLPPIKFYFPR